MPAHPKNQTDVDTQNAQDLLMSLFTLARYLRPSGTTGFTDQADPPAPRHLLALFYLSTKGNMSVSDLASLLGVTLTTASLSVTQMANAGLVEREEDPADHRRTIVSISERVRPMVEETIALKMEKLKIGLQSLGAKRAQALIEDIHHLIQAMDPSTDTTNY